MFFLDLIAALVIAGLLSFILVGLFGWQRPDREGTGPALMFLLLFFLVIIWAGGVWVEPFGPALWGIVWLPFLVIGVLAALVLLTLTPPRKPRNRREALQKAEAEQVAESRAAVVLSIFFWVLFALLVLAIIVRYT